MVVKRSVEWVRSKRGGRVRCGWFRWWCVVLVLGGVYVLESVAGGAVDDVAPVFAVVSCRGVSGIDVGGLRGGCVLALRRFCSRRAA